MLVGANRALCEVSKAGRSQCHLQAANIDVIFDTVFWTGNVINRLSEGYLKGRIHRAAYILINTHDSSEIPARQIRIESI